MSLIPHGTGYRTKTRFAKFYNLPELMALFKEVADIQTSDTLNLPVPKANFETIVVKPSQIQEEMVEKLGERAEEIKSGNVNPKEDNMLKITNEGRKLALDQRLLNNMLPDFENSKVNVCADNIYKIWKETETNKSTQLVFCDLSTPKTLGTADNLYEMELVDGEWKLKNYEFTDVYTDLKRKLIAKGIPENEIAFIHDATNEVKKQELFSKVRTGTIRVLMGSTAKMGAGTNCQNKIIALHHLDCPWRPADLTQRNGRGIRQGNENEVVNIFTYVTEKTFDAYLFQLVETKQKFISQIMTSRTPVRSAEDVDEKALSYAEIKALAAGNPLIIEKTQLDTDVSKLKLLKQSYLSEIYRLEDMIAKYYPNRIKELEKEITNIEKDIQLVTENTNIANEEKFSPMILKGKHYTKKEDAGKTILEICKTKETAELEEIGEYRGMKLELQINAARQEFELFIKGNFEYKISLGNDIYGNITRIDNALSNVEKELEQNKKELENTKKQLENAKIDVKIPFDKEDELKEKSIRLDRVNALLNLNEKESIIMEDDEKIDDDNLKSQDYDKDQIR